jgi:hypothetical protein
MPRDLGFFLIDHFIAGIAERNARLLETTAQINCHLVFAAYGLSHGNDVAQPYCGYQWGSAATRDCQSK